MFVFVLLLCIAGCGSRSYVTKGPEVKTNTINVSNCAAVPDTAQVAKGDTLTWTVNPPDGHTYSITFPHSKPVSSPHVPTGQGQNVKGDFWCSSVGWAIKKVCVYPYNLIQDGSKVCPDPGVHVVPGS